MRLILTLKRSAYILLCTLALLVACKKDTRVLGVEVQPGSDVLGTATESSPVFAHTLAYDSVISLNDRYKYLGCNQDPVFGRTEVGLYLNPNIPDGLTYLNFGDDANLSSAEIVLAVRGIGSSFAGTNASAVSYSVFAQTEQLDPTRIYYTNSPARYAPTSLLGSYTGTLTFLEGKLVLRIPINNNYGAMVLNNPEFLYSNTIFQSTYKGFYIKCSVPGGEGLIVEFDLEDALSGFWLRYKNGQPSATKEEKSFRFIFSGSNINPVRFNTMRYLPASGGNAVLLQQLVNKDSTAGASGLFLKGLGGTRLKVQIPALYDRSDSLHLSVSRAEVVFHVDQAFLNANYPVPPTLCLFPLDSAGRETFPKDLQSTGNRARYNGKYDADNKRYVFDIARHAQAILAGKLKNHGFYLVVASAEGLSSYTNFYNGTSKELILARRDRFIERVVLAGAGHTTLRPQLNLTYVPLPND